MEKVKKKVDPEKVAEEKKKAATESKLLGSDPSQLSEEGLAAALTAAKQRLEESGYGDQAQAVVDKLKAEMQARQEADGKQAEAEHVAKHSVAESLVKEGQVDAVKKAAVNRAKAHKEKQDASPEAKRANIAKQTALPETAAARALAKLPPAEKAKIKARAKIREKAVAAAEKAKQPKAGDDEKPHAADDEAKKTVKLSNGVSFTMDLTNVLDLANTHKGQLAFRYKHGWILINPMVDSRGKLGGALARKYGAKSGTTTKGFFTEKNKFVPTSTGHKTISEQIKDTKNKLAFQVAQKKEDAALKKEVEQVKVDTAKAEYQDAKEKAKMATVSALEENEHQAKAEKHQAAYEAHSKAQTAAANLAEVADSEYANKSASHHSDMALLHQKQVQQEKAKALAEDEKAAAKEKHQAEVAEKIAKLKAEKAKKAADFEKMKAEQAAMVAKAKAKKAKSSAPKFTKVKAAVKVNGDNKTYVEGVSAPKGKLFVHKNTDGTKGYTVSSVSTGEKLPTSFSTQKEAKAAAVWAEENFPGKAFTTSGFQDLQKKNPEAFAEFKSGWVGKKWQDHFKPDAEPTPKTTGNPQLDDWKKIDQLKKDKKLEEGMEAAFAYKSKYGETWTQDSPPSADKPKIEVVEMKDALDKAVAENVQKPVGKLTEKKQAVFDAIDSLPDEEYDKAPPSAWKAYFGAMYDIGHETPEYKEDKKAVLAKGTEAHKKLVEGKVDMSLVQQTNIDFLYKGNKKDKDALKSAAAKDVKTEAPKKYTAEDFHVTLPGPGMYADGNAITSAVEAMKKADSAGASGAEIDARLAAIQEAKAAFKEKHGVEFAGEKVEKTTAPKSAFVPQLGHGEFFNAAKEAGYHHPDFNEDVTEGWTPPHGTKAALKVYTGSGYSSINAQLRKYGTTGGTNDDNIARIDKAFEAAPGLSKPMVTVRRLHDDGPFPGFPPPMDEGAEYIDYGYGSTSKSTTAWSGSVVMEVRMPKGTKVVDVNHNNVVSASTGEQEVLLPRGAKYRVVSDSKDGYQRNIVVEVVSTGHVKGESNA